MDIDADEHSQLIVKMFFDLDRKDTDDKIFCRCCERYFKDNKGFDVSPLLYVIYNLCCINNLCAGHSNLANHARTRHKEKVQEKLAEVLAGPTPGPMGNYVTVTKIVSAEAKNMFGWIEWIVMADLPMTVVENEFYKKRSNLEPTTYKTVTKHMETLLSLVRQNIKRTLPKTFGIIFDGWSCDGEHYVGIFATWVRDDDGSVVKRLIACGVQDLPESIEAASSFGFTADDIGDYLFDVLTLYGRDFLALEFLTGDNAYVNGALCTKIELWIFRNKGVRRNVPLVGCASHKLNLAVQFLCSFEHKPKWFEAISRVHALMVNLKSLKNRVKLAFVTQLNPEVRNETRWRSTYLMLRKYLKLVKETDNFRKCSFERATLNLIPNDDLTDEDSEFSIINEILRSLRKFDELCCWLQKDDPSDVKMSKVRFYFDKIIFEFPVLRPYLGKDSSLVHSPDFDNAVVKIQLAFDQGKSTVPLSLAERAAVALYAFDETHIDSAARSNEDEDIPTFIEEGNAEYESKRTKKQFPYKSTLHISPTSNIVERLFSRCGIIMRPHRRLMDPSTLEMLVMLRFNRNLWGERDVDTVMARKSTASPESELLSPITPITAYTSSSSSTSSYI